MMLLDLARAVLLQCVLQADAHGSMIMPPTRNSIDAELPEWSHGKFPGTGSIEPYSCMCTNGTSECNAGQNCFWFSQGCSIGCKACTGNGIRYPNFDQCPEERTAKPTLLKKYWTANHQAEQGSVADIYKYNPWRAPGTAPVFDACGMAGGNWVEVFNAGAYNTTKFAKQGDLGSKVLKPRPSGTVWKKGSLAKTRWQQTAGHGGGYQFRLCPAQAPLTEECFQKMPLEFGSDKHFIRFKDPSKDFEIDATVVKEGGGLGWMRYPVPEPTDLNCDYNVTKVNASAHCPWKCPGCGAPTYAADAACPTVCSEQFPGTPDNAGADPKIFPWPVPGHGYHDFAIEDTVKVPSDIPAGEYVLGWRWDCEMTSQVWNQCADITIEESNEVLI
eukprot:gb/GFBE01001438.1/.p1 GENE.gb/GFBE01001438.1/~~gb/GFBE01001438.1/.p1  ORF type:complete len:387 (+),score=62.44 gb/GFBE01001438.1/:1-1161(+)